MHIRLPDKHVASHFCLQAFFSKQSFPSLPLSCSSAVILLLFIKSGWSCCSNFTRVCWFRLELRSGFFLPADLGHHIYYVPLQTRYINNIITNIYIYIYIYIYMYIYIYIYIYPELQLVFSSLVLVTRAEVFKYNMANISIIRILC